MYLTARPPYSLSIPLPFSFFLGSNPPSPDMSVGDPTVFYAPCFFLSRGSILPQVTGEDLTSPTRGTGTLKVPGRWSPPSLPPPPPQHDRTRRCMPRSQTAWRGSECGAAMPDFPNERHSVGP